MKKNMGTTDRVIRIMLAVAIAILYISGIISGMMASILLILAGIFILTSFVSVCPLYRPFGISTRKTNKPNTR